MGSEENGRVADPVRFSEAMAEQEWRMRVRLGEDLYRWLEQEAEKIGYSTRTAPQAASQEP